MDELNHNAINHDSFFVDRLDFSAEDAFEFAQNNPPNAAQVHDEVRGNVETLRDKVTAKLDEKFGEKFSSIKGKLPFGGSPKRLGTFLLDGLAKGILASKVLDKTSEFLKKAEVYFDEEGGTQRQAARAAARGQREVGVQPQPGEREQQLVEGEQPPPRIQGGPPPPPPPHIHSGPPAPPPPPPIQHGPPPLRPLPPLPRPPGAGQPPPIVQQQRPLPPPPPPARAAQFNRPLSPIPVAVPQQNVLPQHGLPEENVQALNSQNVSVPAPIEEGNIPVPEAKVEVENQIHEQYIPPPPPPPPPQGQIKLGKIPLSVDEEKKPEGFSPELAKLKQNIEGDPIKQDQLNILKNAFQNKFSGAGMESDDSDDSDRDDDDFWNTPA